MRLINGDNRRPPTPRPRLTGPRTAVVNPYGVMKVINGTRVLYFGPTVVFLDMRAARRER
jgi:hypothetical protein